MSEAPAIVPDPKLLTRYGCGPIRFSGHDDALYERHLLFDDVVAVDKAGARERFEAAAHSVRDVLSQRWILTEDTYAQQNAKRIQLSVDGISDRASPSQTSPTFCSGRLQKGHGRVARPFGFRPHRSGHADFPHPALPGGNPRHAALMSRGE